jgi:hypothetical protein
MRSSPAPLRAQGGERIRLRGRDPGLRISQWGFSKPLVARDKDPWHDAYHGLVGNSFDSHWSVCRRSTGRGSKFATSRLNRHVADVERCQFNVPTCDAGESQRFPLVHPFNTGCSPLSYSGIPGVNVVSYRGNGKRCARRCSARSRLQRVISVRRGSYIL